MTRAPSRYSRHRTWFHPPDVGRVLGNRPIAGKLPRCGNIEDGSIGPSLTIFVERHKSRIGVQVRLHIGQVHIVVAVRYQHTPQRLKNSGLVVDEMVRHDEIERFASLRIVLAVPARIVSAAAAGHLLGRQSQKKKFSSSASSATSIAAPSRFRASAHRSP